MQESLKDKPFKDAYNVLTNELLNVTSENSEESYMNSVKRIKKQKYSAMRDHLQRSMLHVAVEQNHMNLVKYLIGIDLDVNAREGCGMTPLNIAVICKNTDMCKFLVKCGAQCSGPLFTSIP